MRAILRLLSGVFLAGLPIGLWAQSAPPAELFFHVEDSENAGAQPHYELLLRLDANALYWVQDASHCVAELEIEVALTNTKGLLRHETRLLHNLSLPDSICMNGPDSVLIVRRKLRWLPDLQQASIHVNDRNGASLIDHTIELQDRQADADFYLSDLFLCDSLSAAMPTAKPLSDYRIAANRLSLPYHISMYSARPRSLRLSVQLFLRGEANPGAPSQSYQSVFSEIEPLYLNIGVTHLARLVPLEGLPSGEYLAEVYVFDEEEIVAEVSSSFEKAWSGLDEVYSDLPSAVEQLQPRMTSQEEQRLQNALSNRGQQAFDAYWAEIAKRYGEQPRRLVERYYQSVVAMQKEIETDRPWQTDAGRVWLQFGQPDASQRDTLDGRQFTTWSYDRYAMRFVFGEDFSQLN